RGVPVLLRAGEVLRVVRLHQFIHAVGGENQATGRVFEEMATTSGGPSTPVEPTPPSGGREPPEPGGRATELHALVSGSQQPLTKVRGSEASEKTVEELLWEEPFAFDFFQAVRV